MAIAVLALQVANEFLHVVDVVVQMKFTIRQRNQTCVFPVGDVDLVIFEHGFHGITQQGGVVARQWRHNQHGGLVFQVPQGGDIVCKTLETHQITKRLADFGTFMNGNCSLAISDGFDVKLWLFVVLAQAINQAVASSYSLGERILPNG